MLRKVDAGYMTMEVAQPLFRHGDHWSQAARAKGNNADPSGYKAEAKGYKGNNADPSGYKAEAKGYKTKWPGQKGGGGDDDDGDGWSTSGSTWVENKKHMGSTWVETNKAGYSSTQDQGMPQATDDDDLSTWSKPRKGEGKGGNLGTPVPCNLGNNSNASSSKARWDLLKKAPPPIKFNTNETVQEMFDTKYFQVPDGGFWNGKKLWDIQRGTHLLWKNVPLGPNGGESTKHEVFHGQCHGWANNSHVIVS